MLHFVGIDPGASGGIAIVSQQGRVVSSCPMPKGPADIAARLRYVSNTFPESAWFLEFIGPMPMGMRAGAGFGQSFLKHAGLLEGILLGLGAQYEIVHPVKWQNLLECRTRGDKNISKGKAAALFPSEKVTHMIGDALLIAEYGRRKTLGMG